MSASTVIPTPDERALIAAALVLIDQGATAAELAERFAWLEAARRPEGAAALLGHVARLGLARIAAGEGDATRFVLTPLGQRYAAGVLAAQSDVATELEKLERLRTDLLSTIAHELRTPLTAVRTCVGLLLDPDLSPDPAAREQLLRTIAQSAERMQRLVTDVLDIARFRGGAVRLQLRRFDARTLAREAATAVEPLLHSRGQHLDLALPAAAVWVYGDHRRLSQALLNLVSNAHKFSPAGVPMRVAVGARGGDVCWSVADRGPGIAAEDQARLFERFFTAASDSSGPSVGAGLGLPIALAIAQAHGGTIDVDSAAGRGSTFTLRVPAQGPAEAREP